MAKSLQRYKLKSVELLFPEEGEQDWVAGFKKLSAQLLEKTEEEGQRVILALDEYEELHKHLAKEPEKAVEFLGAIRHFMQSQKEVCLMFVGLQFFSELQNPNWNEYFPQSVPIHVGCLNQADTFQLIEVSTLNFEDGIKQRIYDLTQGHPSLVQRICFELVNIANIGHRKNITHTDLDASLKKMVYTQDNGVTDIFWPQNCPLDLDKEIVWAIINQTPLPENSRRRLRRLIEYGFILEEGDNYRMAVPAFEDWVRNFG